MVQDSGPTSTGIGTEPGHVPGCTSQGIRNVSGGTPSIVLGVTGGGVELRHLVGRAAVGVGPLVVGARGGEVTRELDFGGIPISGVDVPDVIVLVDDGEAVRRLDRVLSSPRIGEIVRFGHW